MKLRKTNNVQISFTNNLQKILCKTNSIRFLMSYAFQKTKYYQNLKTENRSKQRFSLLQDQVVIMQCG